MGYFRELPNLYYKNFLTDKKSSLDYIEVKNLFRRVKLRDDLHNILTIFDKYQIPQGHRPELVAEEFYGDQDLDWVVCMTAGIINYEYEVRKNMEKNSIYLLKPRYLQQFLNDMRDIMTYQQSSQYIDERNIQTENLSLTMP
jgi:hypothetical protein